jgi:hypothetical protein
MYKLGHMRGDAWVEHSHPPEYKLVSLPSGTERIVAGIPAGDPVVIRYLAAALSEPFYLLYVLHTPRGAGEPGRYQSPELDRAALDRILRRYAGYLSKDARHDLWIAKPDGSATLVWDRHNLLYAYGPLDDFVAVLRALGFTPGDPNARFEHIHHYRQEFDADAEALLAEFDWTCSPLRPSDEQ